VTAAHPDPGAGGKRYIVGRAPTCDITIHSPRAAARHAELRISRDSGWLRDLGTRYGTTINSRRVCGWERAGPGDRIVVGNTELTIGEAGQISVHRARSGATLCAAGLSVSVAHGRRLLLRNLSFVMRPGELVALMGAAGAGKSTLLDTLAGRISPSSGAVLINGVSLAADPDQARQAVGYVSQDEWVHANLTVREALRYGAALRLPLDTSRDEVEARVAAVMDELGIQAAADILIGSPERRNVCSGSHWRVNLALELLPQRPLLLLDEPASGLSSDEASHLFTILRQLADDGHALIVGTHHHTSLTDFKRFDHVIYLSDGEMVYFGPAWPDSATYFAAVAVAEKRAAASDPAVEGDAGRGLLELMRMRRSGVTAARLADHYRKSDYHSKYVAERLEKQAPERNIRHRSLQLHDFVQQICNQVLRHVRLQLRNRRFLLARLGRVSWIAIILCFVLRSTVPDDHGHTPFRNVLSLMAAAAIWFGYSYTAKDLASEKPVVMRERMIGLGLASYVVSRLVVLGACSLLQCALMLTIAHSWAPLLGALHLPGSLGVPPGIQHFQRELGFLWLCAMVGVLAGVWICAPRSQLS
jgi:ABC transport system ATP-binding/permease protein